MELTKDEFKFINRTINEIVKTYIIADGDSCLDDEKKTYISFDEINNGNQVFPLNEYDSYKEDNTKEVNHICICKNRSDLIDEIVSIQKEKKYEKCLLYFYILVFNFDDKYYFTKNIPVKNTKNVKIDLNTFYSRMKDADDEIKIDIVNTISNSISYDSKYGKRNNTIKSEIFAAKLVDLIKIYKTCGDDLFKDNVRFHINTSKYSQVDENIKTTLKDEPNMFWFYHNGITMILNSDVVHRDKIESISIEPSESFSIINGAQTLYTASAFTYELENSPEELGLFTQKQIDNVKRNLINATVLLRIIICPDNVKTEKNDISLNSKITINLNSQKPVGLEDTLYFEEEIQNINHTFGNKFKIIRNGESRNPSSITLIDFFKFFSLSVMQKPGTARSSRKSLLKNSEIWKALDFSNCDENEINIWFETNLYTALQAQENFLKLKKLEKETNLESEKLVLKYGKEFCLAYYYWTKRNNNYKNDKIIERFIDFDNTNFISDMHAIIDRISSNYKNEELTSNFFKIDKNYMLLKEKIDKINL